MFYLKNPTDNPLEIVYGPNGLGAKYTIKSNEIVAFVDEAKPIYDRFLEVYGFLKEMDEEAMEEIKEADKYQCRYCGRDCKTVLGLNRHEESCKKKSNGKIQYLKIRRINPKARAHRQSQQAKSRSAKEDENFGNTDLAGIGTRTGKDRIGRETQKVVYDKDGVSWYGPGVEDDTSATFRRKAGKFS